MSTTMINNIFSVNNTNKLRINGFKDYRAA